MVELVIIGHVGINCERTPYGEAQRFGGAGYGCARGASVLDPKQIGLVSAVGVDYDFDQLAKLGIDTHGVKTLNGPSARFDITQHLNAERSFDFELGVASKAALSCFPKHYESARHVHICTAPPTQQIEWIQFLRRLPGCRTISCDAFEHYARIDSQRSRAALVRSDLRFLNDEELRLLFANEALPRPAVTKHGAKGATFLDTNLTWYAPAEQVTSVDTTHAGEILAGVFLALRLANVDYSTALSRAVRAATAKVTQFGVDGDRLLRALAEVREEMSVNLRR